MAKLPTPPSPRPNGWNWLGREDPRKPIEVLPFSERRDKKKRKSGFRRHPA